MPLFRRKTAERAHKPSPASAGLVRTPSNRSTRSNTSLPQTPNTPDSWGADNDTDYIASFSNGLASGHARPQTLVLSEAVLEDTQGLPIESLESPLRSSSRLSKTLLEIVRDKNALACFKAFMKSQRAEHFIQFWCDAESFHASTLTRLRTHSLQSLSRKRRSESATSAASETPGVKDDTSDAAEASEASSYLTTEAKEASSSGKMSEVSPISTRDRDALNPAKSHTDDSTCDRVDQPALDPAGNASMDQSSKQSPNMPLRNDAERQAYSKDTGLDQAVHSKAVPSDTHHSSDSHSVFSAEASPCSEADDNESSLKAPGQSSVDIHIARHGADTSPSIPAASQGHADTFSQKLRRSVERDAVTIFSTYIAKDAPQPIGVDDTLRSEAISKICQEDGKVDPECFVNCQRFVLNKMDAEYFQGFRDSAFHCRHQVHVLTTEKVFLPDVLLNENALCYFMEYMEQDSASDLMQVWLCASNFQQQLQATRGTYDPGQAQADAMVIYDKYFSLQATNPVGFDDKLRFEIESNICREEGPLPDCFTKAKNIVLKMLEKTYFPGYLHSQIYHRYLSDLISTVQINEDIPQRLNSSTSSGGGISNSQSLKGHRRAGSDASSEHSFTSTVSQGGESSSAVSSARNTLLAVDTWKVKRSSNKSKISIAADFSMNLDMFNPDDLWKRPQANKLCLGSVTEFGQFVSDFDHETLASERRKASLGPSLFKKSKEKEKEEEEMALRIAQIIISDVNTMTRTGETMAQNKTS